MALRTNLPSLLEPPHFGGAVPFLAHSLFTRVTRPITA